MRFLRVVGGLLIAGCDAPPSGLVSSFAGLVESAETDRLALTAYPELREFMVLLLLSAGSSETPLRWLPFGGGGAVLDTTWRSAFILFFSSFDCSPGHSAGTFISHLLWQVYPQSRQSKPLAESPHIRSPQRSQLVGILKVCDLKLWFCAPTDTSPTAVVMVIVSTSAVNRFLSIS